MSIGTFAEQRLTVWQQELVKRDFDTAVWDLTVEVDNLVDVARSVIHDVLEANQHLIDCEPDEGETCFECATHRAKLEEFADEKWLQGVETQRHSDLVRSLADKMVES